MIIQGKINLILISLAVFVGLIIGINWVLLPSGIINEQNVTFYGSGRTLLYIGIAILFMIAATGYMLANMVTKPIIQFAESLRQMKGGDYDVELKQTERQDEIGEIAKAISQLKENSISLKKLEEKALVERQKEKDRNNFVDSLIATFRRETDRLLTTTDQTSPSDVNELKQELSGTIDRLLKGLASDIENRRKSVRYETEEEVTVEIGPDFFKTSLADKSETGLRMLLVDNLVVGENVIIHFEDSPNKIAKCVWKNEKFAGFEFMVSKKVLEAA